MIRSWRNAASRKVWDGERPNRFRGLDFETAIDLLLALNVAKSLQQVARMSAATCGIRGQQLGLDPDIASLIRATCLLALYRLT